MNARLMRSETDKMFAGVCGGLAVYLGVDSVFVRLAFALLIFTGGIGLPLYFLLMIFMPKEGETAQNRNEIVEKNFNELGETISSGVEQARQHPQGPTIAAGLLILMGVYFLLQNLSWLPIGGPILWAVLLIAAGIYLIIRRSS